MCAFPRVQRCPFTVLNITEGFIIGVFSVSIVIKLKYWLFCFLKPINSIYYNTKYKTKTFYLVFKFGYS